MRIPIFLCVAALNVGIANADFIVYTEPPIPTSAIPSFANQQSVRRVALG